LQGVAGSGKTSIAVHRLSWLLYNYKEIKPKQCLIMAPSKLFLNYIKDILPEIGSEKVPQTTFEDWALRKLFPIIGSIELTEEDRNSEHKSTVKFMRQIEDLAAKLRKEKDNYTSSKLLLSTYQNYVESKHISKYDLPGLVYMKYLLQGTSPAEKIDYLVVDEAQDHTIAELLILRKFTQPGRTMLAGDVMQNIITKHGIKDWEEVLSQIFIRDDTDFYSIKVSYRSTKNIIQFVNERMKSAGISANMLPRPVLREGPEPDVTETIDVEELLKQIPRLISDDLEAGMKNIAIIVPKKYMELFSTELNKTVKKLTTIKDFETGYSGGPALGFVQVFKGIEFDSVILVNIPDTTLPRDQQLRQFYVSCTRAMHRLHIFEENTAAGESYTEVQKKEKVRSKTLIE
jgi:DNA helicase IV